MEFYTVFYIQYNLFLKKLNSDLAGLQKEKEDLLRKLETSSEITSLAEEISRVTVPRVQVTSLGPSRSMDLEMKQLQCKLKVIAEYIKHANLIITEFSKIC